MSTQRTVPLYSLRQALDSIPQLDGDPDTTAFFCKVERQILDKFPSSERHIFRNLVGKLGREADRCSWPNREKYDGDVEWLLRDVTLYLGYPEKQDQIYSEFETVWQKPAKRVVDYGRRVEALLYRLLDSHQIDRIPFEFKEYRDFFQWISEGIALRHFLDGLHENLEHHVRSKNPRNLREAINEAITIEYKIYARRVLTESHANNRQLNNYTEEQYLKSNHDERFCEYCKIRGHFHSECEDLKLDLRTGKISRKKCELSAENTPPSSILPVQALAPNVYAALPPEFSASENTCKTQARRSLKTLNNYKNHIDYKLQYFMENGNDKQSRQLRRDKARFNMELRANTLKTEDSSVSENIMADVRNLVIITNSVTQDESSDKREQGRIPYNEKTFNYAHNEMIEDTVEFGSIMPLCQETLVNNVVVEYEKSNNHCYITCNKLVVTDPPIVIFESCIITPKMSDVFDAQGKSCYDDSKLKCANSVSSFSKNKKNETFKEFKLGDTNTREDLNIEKSEHIHESIKNHQAVKQLYSTHVIINVK